MAHELTKPLTERGRYWVQHIRQWQQTEITQAEYCRGHHLSVAAFGWWRRQLIKQGVVSHKNQPGTVQTSSDRAAFVEVSTVDSLIQAPRYPYEITLTPSRRLGIHRGFDPQEVAALVSVLEPSC